MDPKIKRGRFHDQGEASEQVMVDRISALPNSLILHILSLLPMEDVVRTSSLSKDWQYIWTRVDAFNFTTNNFRLKDFVTFVNNTLIQSKCLRVRKFVVACNVAGATNSGRAWIRFATDKKVENLELIFKNYDTDPNSFYELPLHLYSNSSLRNMKLRRCLINSSRKIHWDSLETLVIEKMDVTDVTLENVFSGCHVLKIVVLRELCGDQLNLIINSRSLRKLIVDGWEPTEMNSILSHMRIESPSLEELHISGVRTWNVGWMGGLWSLVHVSFEFTFSYHGFDSEIQKMVDILSSVKHVRKVTLGIQCVKALAVAQLRGFQHPILKCKHLVLDSYLTMFELPGVLWLLQAASDLETLVVTMSGNPLPNFPTYRTLFETHDGESYLSKQKDMRILTRLKNVKIVDSRRKFWSESHNLGVKSFLLELVQFILQYAKSLEMMNFDSGMATELSSFSRSSTHANFIIS